MSQEQHAPQPAHRRCPECGGANSAAAQFCHVCGASLLIDGVHNARFRDLVFSAVCVAAGFALAAVIFSVARS
jgi:hypothetical protein